MFFVEFATANKFIELAFEIDVTFEELVFETHANDLTKDFSRDCEFCATDLELSFHESDFGKGEFFVRD